MCLWTAGASLKNKGKNKGKKKWEEMCHTWCLASSISMALGSPADFLCSFSSSSVWLIQARSSSSACSNWPRARSPPSSLCWINDRLTHYTRQSVKTLDIHTTHLQACWIYCTWLDINTITIVNYKVFVLHLRTTLLRKHISYKCITLNLIKYKS